MENAYFECEVLHIVLKRLWGVDGSGNVGDVESFSCRVVKTKHYVDLHAPLNISKLLGYAANLRVRGKAQDCPPKANHKRAPYRSTHGEPGSRMVRKPVLSLYTSQWRRQVGQPMSIPAGGSLGFLCFR